MFVELTKEKSIFYAKGGDNIILDSKFFHFQVKKGKLELYTFWVGGSDNKTINQESDWIHVDLKSYIKVYIQSDDALVEYLWNKHSQL